MSTPAIRSQLLQLRRDLDAAREGRDLLDQKREAIVRALADHLHRRDARMQVAARALAAARAALVDAQDELGRAAIDAAALAQPPGPACTAREITIAATRVPQIDLDAVPFRPRYGPASGSAALDAAGDRFAAALAALALLASEEAAVQRLRAALARTARRQNALDQIVLPELGVLVRSVTAALEEEERDEATRRKIGAGTGGKIAAV
jgi:V/A-type H+-transporting ATPase subunit D